MFLVAPGDVDALVQIVDNFQQRLYLGASHNATLFNGLIWISKYRSGKNSECAARFNCWKKLGSQGRPKW